MEKTFEIAKEQSCKNMVMKQMNLWIAATIELKCVDGTVLPLMYLYYFKMKWKGLQNLIMIESKREIKD